MEIGEKIQWHPAFCSAMELELLPYKKYLRYEREHNLGKMPLRIDFLVIRKEAGVRIENEIGDFFLGANIFEYKSPGDAVNVGTLCKALSYAYLYKAEGEAAESLDMDMTISIVREEKPPKLLRQLGEKYSVEHKAKGIYRVGGLPMPLQIVATKELDRDAHVWASSLTRAMDKENAHRLLYGCAGLEDDEDRKNADSVLNVASEANIGLFRKMIQEGDRMCEELKELLAPEIIEFKIRLAKQNEQLADNAARLADNAARLADNAARLADKDARLADKDARLADKDIEIERLKRMLAKMGVNA